MQKIEHRSGVEKKHPDYRIRILSLVSIEMWERFSFYGMQALLVYYLYFAIAEGGMGMDRAKATALVGAYGAALYLSAWAGGWVGDRLLGSEKTLLGGALLVTAGHLILSGIPGQMGLICGLGAIALGSGCVKTSAITVLGSEEDSSTGEANAQAGPAFQYFYLGINVGALLGPLLTGWLSKAYGFCVGFAAAAVLMIIGLGVYLGLRRRMLASFSPGIRARVEGPQLRLPSNRRWQWAAGILVAILVIIVAFQRGWVSVDRVSSGLLLITVLAAIWLFAQPLAHPAVSMEEKAAVRRFIPLFLCSTVFWMLQAQTYGVLAVFAQERTNRWVGDFEIPAAWAQSLNPLFILGCSVPLAFLWARLRGRAPQLRTTIGGGLILASTGLLLPAAFVHAEQAPLWVLPAAIFLISCGELFIGPGGMAATAHHAPRAFATRFSALYFLTLAIGMSLAGRISTYYDPESSAAELRYFLLVALIPMALGLITLLSAPSFRRRFLQTNPGVAAHGAG
ncbi:peptide MFS transporter [Corynebacterium flavescens]|uniref:peptide MFS transporter n=1 Tax=Corynebacterium flavescens TaxID=28028 RepID=UPI003F90F0EC